MSPSALSHEPKKPKVVSLGYPARAGEDYLKEFESRFDLHVVTPSDRKGTIRDLAARVAKDGPFEAIMILMGIGPYEPFDEELLKPLVPHCKLFVSASAGYNEFDVDWMTKNKMYFCNTRNAVSEPTADLAIFFILAVLRDTLRAERQVQEGAWRGTLSPTRDPSGMTLGIIGMGAIGKHLARKAEAFNMKVIYYNRRRLPADEEGKYQATYCSTLEELFASAEIVSVHCPLNDATTGMIGAKEFAQMKDGVFFINTSRGPIVDEAALIAALESGKVARAGLDVFANEPNINPYFRKSDRCTVQPHMGGLSDVAWRKAFRECLDNITAFFTTGRPVAPVNNIE